MGIPGTLCGLHMTDLCPDSLYTVQIFLEFPHKIVVTSCRYLILLCLLSFFFSLSMSSLARRNTSVISASMDREAGEEPGGWPGAGLRLVEANGEREESRATCRRNDSFMASLSRSLDLRREEGQRRDLRKV